MGLEERKVGEKAQLEHAQTGMRMQAEILSKAQRNSIVAYEKAWI